MEKLTFKQYLETKAELLEALKKSPKHSIRYHVNKYCNLIVGENKENKEYIPLKPKNEIVVEWLYEDLDNPTIINVSVEGNNNKHIIFWETERFSRWLNRNTKQLHM